MSDDDGELSDSTRAALRIQREIEGGGAPESESRASKAPPKSKKNDEKYGAITGIALGEYSKGSSGPAQIKMKGGKAGLFSESLESLAYRQDSDEEVNPEAPKGCVKRKDLERQAGNAGNKSNVGLDGKVYAFIDAPSDESSGQEAQKGAEKDKDTGKKKKKAKKDKKSKKDRKKKEKKKGKKRKRSSSEP
mmetsp:Transcript_10856/g.11944  ORF Transcript_10856/g.11944 Transcript_10856/m.11944 type:complete len:191 (+) Transcript_10856:154-726(+)